MEHVPYCEVFRVLVMERNKNLKNIFFYQCIKDIIMHLRQIENGNGTVHSLTHQK